MAVTARILNVLALVSTIGFVGGAGAPAYAQGTSGESRVRSGSPKLTALIQSAEPRSHTFRALLASIEATDGIVFVEEGTCGHGVRACLTWSVTLAGRYRMLFIRLSTRAGDVDLTASIAHELQHALEVLGVRSLRTSSAIGNFYRATRQSSTRPAFETALAIQTGNAVAREMQHSRAREKREARSAASDAVADRLRGAQWSTP
jgi:hypothetical protein